VTVKVQGMKSETNFLQLVLDTWDDVLEGLRRMEYPRRTKN